MKRTTELTFTAIGMCLFGLLAIGSALLLPSIRGNSSTEKLVSQFLSDENITDISMTQVVHFFYYGMLYLLIISIICAIVGFIVLFSLKRNKNPRLAGKLLIVVAIIGTIATLIVGIFGGLAYLIAGIVAMSKKNMDINRGQKGEFDVRYQS